MLEENEILICPKCSKETEELIFDTFRPNNFIDTNTTFSEFICEECSNRHYENK